MRLSHAQSKYAHKELQYSEAKEERIKIGGTNITGQSTTI